METEKYLFRRQFILGPRPCGAFEKWKQIKVADDLHLSVHPDLAVTELAGSNIRLILLGFILDPDCPDHDNREILSSMAGKATQFDELFEEMAAKGGRFALIAVRHGKRIIFSDAAGFRQIFYHRDRKGNIWCSSQPEIIAEQCDVLPDEEARNDLYRLPLFSNSTEYWFPGNQTLFRDIYHLTPNHYLNMGEGTVERYWPRRKLDAISPEECVRKSSDILTGLLKSVTSRFDAGLGITAGLDTRLVFSACREVKDSLYYFTHTHGRLDTSGPDIVIPQRMLEKHGLNHHVIHHANAMSPEYEKIFRRNVTAARTRIGINAYSIQEHFTKIDKEMVLLNGVCGEITRCFYRFPGFFPLSGKTLAVLADMPGSRLAERQFGAWLASAQSVTDQGVNLLDLFYWENRNGNWSAMSYSEYDIAFESYSPMNCHQFLECLLRVDRSYRMPPRYDVHRGMIHHMWPELLDFPINPPRDDREAAIMKIKGLKSYEALRFLKFLKNYYISAHRY